MRVGDAGVWSGRRSSCRTGASSHVRSTTGSARTSRSRRHGGSPRPATRRSTSSRSPRCRRSSASTARGRPRSRSTRRRDRDRRHATRPTSRRRPAAGRAVELGSGATIGRGPILNTPRLRPARASGARRRRSRTRSRSRRGRRTTDADEVHVSRAGVPTGLVSIPLRYMHSPERALRRSTTSRRSIALVVAFAQAARPRDELPALASTRAPQRHRQCACGRRSASSAAGSPLTRRPSSARSRSGRRSSASGSSRTSREYVIMGQVLQGGAGQAPARQAAIGAGCRSRRRPTRSTRCARRRSGRSRSPTR